MDKNKTRKILNSMMKKLNEWLMEHFSLWAWDEQQGPVHLWSILITIVLTIIWHFANLDWAILWQGLAGIVTFGLPLLAGIIALIKKQPWNPWYWFPAVAGVAIGGIISIGIGLIFGWAS